LWQRTVPTFLMQIFGQKGVTKSAQAEAQTSTTAGSIGGCIFVLDPSASGAFNIHGTMNLDSNSSSAFVGDQSLRKQNKEDWRAAQ
jgi:hypothetical protein